MAKTWEFQSESIRLHYRMQPSGNYVVFLAPTGAPYKKTKKLSQVIEPNEVARFTFSINLDISNRASRNLQIQHVFLLTLNLIYDEDNRVVAGGKFLIVMDHAFGPRHYFFPNAPPNSHYGRLHSHNQEVLDEIRKSESINSESLKKLIRNTSQNDDRPEEP